MKHNVGTRGRGLRRAAIVAAGVALATSFGGLGTAQARPAPSNTSPIHTSAWAGYQSQPGDGLASASTTFKIPKIDCSAGVDAGQSFGVYGGDGSVHNEIAVVETYCDTTTPVYQFYVKVDRFEFTEPGANP